MRSYVKLLKLEGHQEGGYFGLFYKSLDKVSLLNERYYANQSDHSPQKNPIERNAGSSIYYLLEKNAFSAWHRLKSDEVWHYYDGGSPIDIHVIDENGKYSKHILGNPGITEEAHFQSVLKAGVWFAVEVRDKTSFGLAGCTVSPAFEYYDCEFAETYRDDLVKLNPELTTIIDKFIKPNVIKSTDPLYDHSYTNCMKKLSASDYINKLNMEKHPEGGYFSVSYTATDMVLPHERRYKVNEMKESQRAAGSAIYFLLSEQDFSAWHQLKSDEIWHYYDGGSPINIHSIDKDGNLKTQILGNPFITENASFQVIIKAGDWFAAEPANSSSFGLVGCTVTPGFEYHDFILADRDHFSEQYKEHANIINRLTRLEGPSHSTQPTHTAE